MITEEMMAAAAAEMNEAMLRSLPEPEDCYHEFSAKFEKKMKRVIYRADHPLQFRILQKVASIILVLFLGFATIMAISPTVRASVFGWIREQYESFMTYYFEDRSKPDSRNAEYYIDGLDDEFTLVYSSFDGSVHFQVYENTEGQQLYYTYATKFDRNAHFIEQDKCYVEHITINGHPADLYVSTVENESNCIIWSDEDAHIIFYIAAPINPDKLVYYAENTMKK